MLRYLNEVEENLVENEVIMSKLFASMNEFKSLYYETLICMLEARQIKKMIMMTRSGLCKGLELSILIHKMLMKSQYHYITGFHTPFFGLL